MLKRDLLTAAVPGSLLLILLYAAGERLGWPYAFPIALGAGALTFLAAFLALLLTGLSRARRCDEWEKSAGEFLYRTDATRFEPGKKPRGGKLYLFSEKLLFVSIRGKETETVPILREEIEGIGEGSEDFELFLTGGRVESFLVTDRKAAAEAVEKAFGLSGSKA